MTVISLFFVFIHSYCTTQCWRKNKILQSLLCFHSLFFFPSNKVAKAELASHVTAISPCYVVRYKSELSQGFTQNVLKVLWSIIFTLEWVFCSYVVQPSLLWLPFFYQEQNLAVCLVSFCFSWEIDTETKHQLFFFSSAAVHHAHFMTSEAVAEVTRNSVKCPTARERNASKRSCQRPNKIFPTHGQGTKTHK